jgi:hypothetical protein
VIIIVVGRRMAGAAICQAGMAKFSVIPILGVVALRALAGEMIARRCMAGLAVIQAIVIDVGIVPIIGVVAVGTLTGEVVAWGVAAVAAYTVGEATVIEIYIAPAAGIMTL